MPRWVRGGYAAGLAVLVMLYFALPHAPRYLWTILGVSSVLALVIGTLVNRPRHRLPWLLVAAGVSGLIAGDTTYDLLTGPLGMDNPFPSVADGFYLAMNPLIAAGLLLMVRARTTETDWEALLDALIVTIGLGLLSWVFLAQPYVADSTLSVTEKAFSIAYPFGDVLLLAVLARLVIGSGARTTSLALLTAGTLGLLSSDVLYGWIRLNGEWHTGGPVDLGWVVFYAALGGAALKPDMVRLAEPERRPLLAMSRSRLLLLGSVSLVAPGLLLWETLSGRNENIATVAVASGTLFVLVTVGLALTVTQVLLVLVGGVLSDRFERRKVMLAADVVRALALALLAWLSLSGHLALWRLVAVAGVYGAASAFFMPAFEALVPSAASVFVSGFEAVGAVAWMTTKQRLVPGQLLGRVSSFDWFISIALVPLSYAVTA